MSTAQITPSRQGLSANELQIARDTLQAGGQWGRVVLALAVESEQEAIQLVAEHLDLQTVDLTQVELDRSLLREFPARLIHRHRMLPLRRDGDSLVIAIANPFDLTALDAASAATGASVTPVLTLPDELSKLIKRYFGVGAETVEGMLAQTDEESDGIEVLDDVEWDDSEASEMAQQPSVVRLVNEILSEAVDARASDIHLEAQAQGLKIRYRIDGVLQDQPTPPEINRFQSAIISRLKIMARLNIAERRVPQDGRIKLKVSGREVDVRVSMIPMLHGEGIVMRVLDKDRLQFSLQGIGMNSAAHASFQQLIRLPHGIILVTGPTGSGKTTTLYSALNEIKGEETKIITTEDPIEYQLDGINQIQVNPKVGLTFAASLRSILRHDPDVVLVGEIRDLETAENAIQASLTGHLVFSTLHTNDAASAFMRLVDMGVEPFLVSSTVEGVLAQRLVRVLCPECREPFVPSEPDLPDDFPIDQLHAGGSVYRAAGCRACRGLGYLGREGIYELLQTSPEIRQLASERAPGTVVKEAAVRGGMRTLRQDGWSKVLAGRTTIEEVLRVTKAD